MKACTFLLLQLLLQLLLLLLLVPACSVKSRMVPQRVNETTTRAMSSHTVVIDPTTPLFPTGIRIEKNQTYLFTAVTALDINGKSYADKLEATNPSSPDGPDGGIGVLFDSVARDVTPHNPKDLKRLRVLRDRDGNKAHFLTLIGVVGPCKDSQIEHESFVIGSRRVWQSGSRSGILNVFANDWPPGSMKEDTYGNNLGTLILSVTELPAKSPLR